MNTVVVEVLGGVVQNVYVDDPKQTQVVVVDWDEDMTSKPSSHPTQRLNDMPRSTSRVVLDNKHAEQ